MESSQQSTGSHATASPCGRYIASIHDSKLRISSALAPERGNSINIRAAAPAAAKDTNASIKWNEESTRIAILSAQSIEVSDLDDSSLRIRLDNGSGGLGRFSSASFIGSQHLLVTWEFGKTKLWDLSNGKAVELTDVKTACSGTAWQMRPSSGNPATRTLALLSRPGAEDMLNVYFPAAQKQLSCTKLSTTDAQSFSWSPDGRWLAVLDTPSAGTSVHIFTPDGHRFRSYPSKPEETSSSPLGIKACIWSPNSQILALTQFNGKITLLNTRTFAPLAIIEHTATVDQRSLPAEQQAAIWQEAVSAAGERSYTPPTQPVSPLLSRTKATTEPNELGVAEACFSCDGAYLATRDERMLSTIWIWNMATLSAHAVLIQHSNVRKLHWHPTQTDLLMVDCAEGIFYLFHAASGFSMPPASISTSMSASVTLSWVHTASTSKTALIAATKSAFQMIYPEGIPDATISAHNTALSRSTASEAAFDEGASEDSLFEVLSGRQPLHPRTEKSYTERIDMEVETEDEDVSIRVDDTFRERKKSRRPTGGGVVDPLDDSQIF